MTTWQTDDQCPGCGARLTTMSAASGLVTDDCPACGWTITWQAGERQ